VTAICQSCERPGDAYLCWAPDCWPALDADLDLMGWLDEQLTISRTRQARLGSGRRPAGETALGYGVGAARAQDALRNTVTTWARDILLAPATFADVDELCQLLRDPSPIRYHPAAGEIAQDFERARRRGLAVINPQDDGMVYGVCGAELDDGGSCPAVLYGDAEDSYVRCRRCRTQHETRDRRARLRARLEVLYMRAATLARVLPRLLPDRPVSASNIRNWAAQQRPIRTKEDDAGWITYHCGDVMDVATSTPKRMRRMEGSAA